MSTIEPIPEVFYEWPVEKISSLTKMIHLPTFSTNNHSWHLCLYPNNSSKYIKNTNDFIGLFLCNNGKGGLESTVNMSCTLHIRTTEKTIYSYSFMNEFAKGSSRAVKRPQDLIRFPQDILFVGCRIVLSKGPSYFPHPSLTAALLTQLNNASTADVEFLVGPSDSLRPLYAQRGVLSARSRYFATMFASGLRESYTESGSSQRTVIRVPDFDPMVFETLLRYLYSGQTKFDVDPADVFLVADKYDAPLLAGVAELRIVQSLNPDRVCRLLVTHGHMSSELREVLVWYLVGHFEEARETEGFGFMLESAKSSLIEEVMVELNGKRGSKGEKRPRLF